MTPGSMLPYAVALLLLLIGGKDNYGAEHMAATSFDFRLLQLADCNILDTASERLGFRVYI